MVKLGDDFLLSTFFILTDLLVLICTRVGNLHGVVANILKCNIIRIQTPVAQLFRQIPMGKVKTPLSLQLWSVYQ